MRKNNISEMIFRPVSENQEDNKRKMMSSDVSTDKNFLKHYQDHIASMKIVAECAKIFIMENWEKIKDWSLLEVVIEDNSKIDTDYYQYTPNETGFIKLGSVMTKAKKRIDEKNKKRHNPIIKISEVVLDPSDGDFSLTINGKDHLWISDDSIIIIADFIEKSLKSE